MKTSFKKARQSDTDPLIALAKKTVDKSYRSFLDDKTVDNYLASDSLDNFLQNNFKHTWIFILDYKIVGFSICIENVIEYMMIDVDFHRQGLGTLLLQNCESLLFEKYQIIALESYEKNTKARMFYEDNNWKVTEKYKDMKSGAIKLIFRKHCLSKPIYNIMPSA